MANRIASISGVFLAPGVSRNNRYYSPEVVSAAVENMQRRLDNGDVISMATSHAAGRTDDALATAGAVRKVWVDESGFGRFTADVPPTTTGRDAVELLRGKYAGGVSIDADWFNVRRQLIDGKVAEAGDNLMVKRIDLTGRAGILGAQIDTVSITESVHDNGAVSIRESFDGVLFAETGATHDPSDDHANAAEAATSEEIHVTEKATPAADPKAEPVQEAVVAAPAAVELSESAVKSLATAIAEAMAPAFAALKPAEATPVAEAVVPAPDATPLTESVVQKLIADAAEAWKAEVRDMLKEAPAFGRRGLATRTAESVEPAKPLEKMSAQELSAHRTQEEAGAILSHFGIDA